jgi:hypothetical protein
VCCGKRECGGTQGGCGVAKVVVEDACDREAGDVSEWPEGGYDSRKSGVVECCG